MTVKELRQLLATLPDETIIYTPAVGDDIMGDYHYNPVIGLDIQKASKYKRKSGGITMYAVYSNYAGDIEDDVTIHVLC